MTFLDRCKSLVTKFLEKNIPTKLRIDLYCEFQKATMAMEGVETKDVYIRANTKINIEATDEREIYDEMCDEIKNKIYKYTNDGNGWQLVSVIKLLIHTVTYKPLSGSSYIKLP